MMVAMDKENEKKIVHDIDALKVKFPGMGVKIFSTKISRVK
jgi:hypothetical protein